jgi:hypothetical protein
MINKTEVINTICKECGINRKDPNYQEPTKDELLLILAEIVNLKNFNKEQVKDIDVLNEIKEIVIDISRNI